MAYPRAGPPVSTLPLTTEKLSPTEGKDLPKVTQSQFLTPLTNPLPCAFSNMAVTFPGSGSTAPEITPLIPPKAERWLTELPGMLYSLSVVEEVMGPKSSAPGLIPHKTSLC